MTAPALTVMFGKAISCMIKDSHERPERITRASQNRNSTTAAGMNQSEACSSSSEESSADPATESIVYRIFGMNSMVQMAFGWLVAGFHGADQYQQLGVGTGTQLIQQCKASALKSRLSPGERVYA